MNRDFVLIRIEQLPIAIFGIIHAGLIKGTAMPFFDPQAIDCQNCEMTRLL